MRIVLYIFILSFCLLSCKTNTQKTQIPEYILKELEQLSLMPDSLLTNKQLHLKENLFDIIVNSVKIENKKFVNTSTPIDFEKRKLSKYYYYILEKNIEELNQADFSPKSLHEIYDEMLERYFVKKE